jgi:hypothetical protein
MVKGAGVRNDDPHRSALESRFPERLPLPFELFDRVTRSRSAVGFKLFLQHFLQNMLVQREVRHYAFKLPVFLA